MRIKKILGNNVVSSVDENNNEIIVTGKGIGFNAKRGSEIDEEKITRIFSANEDEGYYFKELVKRIPESYIEVANDIISYAQLTLDNELSDFIYITLTDHLNYAIERFKEGVSFENHLLWEIKRYYNDEYQIGKTALKMIEKKLGYKLPEDEAGFLAMHIVNAELGTDLTQTSRIPAILKDLVNLIKYFYNKDFSEDSLDFERFITHLKFFLQRAVKNETYKVDDPDLCALIINKYPEAYQGALKIQRYMEQKMDYAVSLEELMYLTIHIKKLIDD